MIYYTTAADIIQAKTSFNQLFTAISSYLYFTDGWKSFQQAVEIAVDSYVRLLIALLKEWKITVN